MYKLKTIALFPSSGGTNDYEQLQNKPLINGIELVGDKSLDELGIQEKGNYINDANYVHTDNNYTNEGKSKLDSLENYDDSEIKQDINNLDIEVEGLTENVNNIASDVARIDENVTTQQQSINNLTKNKADKTEIPDVSEFVKKSVNDLTNYYLKSETYTQSEVNQLIGAIKTISMKVVPSRPETGEANIIYLVPSEKSKTENVYEEYIYVDNKWELIGTTDVGLSNYYTKDEINTLLFDYITSNDLEETLGNYALKSEIPTKTSEIENDSDFTTNEYVDGEIDKIDAELATRLATDLENIDQAGIDYINGLIDDKIGNIDAILQDIDTGSGV